LSRSFDLGFFFRFSRFLRLVLGKILCVFGGLNFGFFSGFLVGLRFGDPGSLIVNGFLLCGEIIGLFF